MQNLIKELRYDNGDLYWTCQDRNNSRDLSKPVGCVNSKGYRVFSKLRKQYYTHIVIFFMKNGYLPEQVDHKDGNTLNNFDWNLRASTVAQNQWNSRKSSRNRSGTKGVSWDKKAGRWHVSVCANGKRHFGGLHITLERAVETANKLRRELHGSFTKI